MNISIIIPVYNEEKSLAPLYQELLASLKPLKKTFEIIFINDGSTDQSLKTIKALQKKDKRVKTISFRGNLGKSAALKAGFQKSRGEIVITLDADLQDDPAEIPRLIEKINEGYDLVSGWKKRRHDPKTKVLPSRIYNSLASLLSGVKLHDFNCGLKAYRQEVVKNLSLYGELYRLIPILVSQEKFRVGEIPIHHRPRRFGKSKFGGGRFLKGFLDMITVLFLSRFIQKPAHFFGSVGLALFSLGFLLDLYVTFLKITTGSTQGKIPLLLAGILLIVVGLQLLSTGLLAEMFLFFNQKKIKN